MNKVVISLGKGNLETGLALVTAQLWSGDEQLIFKQQGYLDANPQLLELYQQWRSLYLAYYLDSQQSMRIEIIEEDESPLNFSQTEFKQICKLLAKHFNIWLGADSFADIRWHLGINLHPAEEIQIVIETEDVQLRQLPWHLWNFLEDYPLAEIALSLPVYQSVARSSDRNSSKINVLGVLGNPIDNEIETDKLILKQASQGRVKILHQPSLTELKAQLRQGNWDIFFFAGHSSSETEAGNLLIDLDRGLNTTAITELEPALKQSIRQGLQLAIFNSCDGLALAWSLARLNIPQTIVMSQPVTDEVAQVFLQHFLNAITQGKSSYLAVRQAREQLKDLEDEYPCASWLPTICQNPATSAFVWQPLKTIPHHPNHNIFRWQRLAKTTVLSLAVTALTIGTRSLGLWQGIELKTYDWLVKMLPHQPVDDRFLLITVDEADIQYQDRQGIERTGSLGDEALDKILTKLLPYQPKAIALDIYHDSPFEPQLAHKLAQTNFIAACEIAQSSTQPYSIAPPPNLDPESVGFTDFPIDSDNVVRRQLLLMDSTVSCPTDTSFSLRVALKYLAQTQKNISLEFTNQEELKIGEAVFPRFSHNSGGYQLPLAEALGYQVITHDTVTKFPEVNLRDLLETGLDSQMADLVQNKIILIGAAKSSKDSHRVVRGQQSSNFKMSGMEIHASIIGRIISAVEGDDTCFLWWWQEWQEQLWIALWSGIGGLVIFYSNSRRQFISASFAALVSVTGLTIFLFYQGGWIPFFPTLFVFIATNAVIFLFKLNS